MITLILSGLAWLAIVHAIAHRLRQRHLALNRAEVFHVKHSHNPQPEQSAYDRDYPDQRYAPLLRRLHSIDRLAE